jgi:hypothetical protein
MFKKARDVMDDSEIASLGAEMEARKGQLQAANA